MKKLVYQSVKFDIGWVINLISSDFTCDRLSFLHVHILEYTATCFDQDVSHKDQADGYDDSVNERVLDEGFQRARNDNT